MSYCEAVQRLNTPFGIQCAINGRSAADRHAVRQELSAPLEAELHAWPIDQRHAVAQPHEGRSLHAPRLRGVYALSGDGSAS